MKRTLQIHPNLTARSEHPLSLNSLPMFVGNRSFESGAHQFADRQNISDCYAISDSLIRWSYPEVNLS
jgi:hypothetical protein